MALFRRFLTGQGPEAKAILKALQLDHLAVQQLTLTLAPDQVIKAELTIAVQQQQLSGVVELLERKTYALTELVDPDQPPTETTSAAL